MQKSLEIAFPQIKNNNCLEFSDKESFYILDDANKVAQIADEGILKIINPQKTLLGFLKIDHCFLHDNDPNKCDCAIYNDSIFCFIEISEAHTKNRKDKRKHAYEQLSNTIKLFLSKGISFEKHNLEALVAFDFEESYPSSPSKNLEKRKEFADAYGAKLIEGNSKEL